MSDRLVPELGRTSSEARATGGLSGVISRAIASIASSTNAQGKIRRVEEAYGRGLIPYTIATISLFTYTTQSDRGATHSKGGLFLSIEGNSAEASAP